MSLCIRYLQVSSGVTFIHSDTLSAGIIENWYNQPVRNMLSVKGSNSTIEPMSNGQRKQNSEFLFLLTPAVDVSQREWWEIQDDFFCRWCGQTT